MNPNNKRVISPKEPKYKFCRRGHPQSKETVKFNQEADTIQCRTCIVNRARYKSISKRIETLQKKLEELKDYKPVWNRKSNDSHWDKPIPGS